MNDIEIYLISVLRTLSHSLVVSFCVHKGQPLKALKNSTFAYYLQVVSHLKLTFLRN